MSDKREADHVYLFIYGTLKVGGEAAWLLRGCERVAESRVRGALYNISDEYPALVLDGNGEVLGEVWRCPAELLPRLDAFERVSDGLYRRVRIQVGEHPCWTYVAGPALAPVLVPHHRIPSGQWPPPPPLPA